MDTAGQGPYCGYGPWEYINITWELFTNFQTFTKQLNHNFQRYATGEVFFEVPQVIHYVARDKNQ